MSENRAVLQCPLEQKRKKKNIKLMLHHHKFNNFTYYSFKKNNNFTDYESLINLISDLVCSPFFGDSLFPFFVTFPIIIFNYSN